MGGGPGGRGREIQGGEGAGGGGGEGSLVIEGVGDTNGGRSLLDLLLEGP